jgi:putative tricarboxylic transport membrane protein
MRLRLAVDGADLFLGIVALGVSVGYLYEAALIPESLLADAVGAAGMPRSLGWAMVALGLILCARGLVSGSPALAVPPPAPSVGTRLATRPHVLAVGLLSILAAYAALLPYAGYRISTALLIGTVARFAGTTFTRSLPIIAIVGGLVLWLLFDPLLGTTLPIGGWWEGH